MVCILLPYIVGQSPDWLAAAGHPSLPWSISSPLRLISPPHHDISGTPAKKGGEQDLFEWQEARASTANECH